MLTYVCGPRGLAWGTQATRLLTYVCGPRGLARDALYREAAYRAAVWKLPELHDCGGGRLLQCARCLKVFSPCNRRRVVIARALGALSCRRGHANAPAALALVPLKAQQAAVLCARTLASNAQLASTHSRIGEQRTHSLQAAQSHLPPIGTACLCHRVCATTIEAAANHRIGSRGTWPPPSRRLAIIAARDRHHQSNSQAPPFSSAHALLRRAGHIAARRAPSQCQRRSVRRTSGCQPPVVALPCGI